MTPAAIIETACREGVMLTLSAAGTIKAIGDGAVVNRWLPTIRERKAEIIGVLKGGNREPVAPIAQQPAPMTAEHGTAIRAWLTLIGEIDPVTIAEVIDGCQRDMDTRRYFVGRATADLPKPAPVLDDRRTCNQCANLIARRCQAAKRGEIVASRSYEPIRDLLQRCSGYAPGTDDPDRRPGHERWPGLSDKRGAK